MSHASPVIAGWVWRKSMLGLGTARRNYCVLDSNKTMYFYSVKPKSPVEASDHLRLKLTSEDITEIELLEDKTIVLGCRFRVYEMRSENGDLEAERWVEALREATGIGNNGGAGGMIEEGGIPWMVDGAWLDEMLPAPLTMVTKVNLSPNKEKHSAHVRLADGSTFTVEGLEVGGEGKEVASAGNRQLIAHLEKGGEPSKKGKKAGAAMGLLNALNHAFAHTPVACAATMLIIRHWPNLHASDHVLYAIIAIYAVGIIGFVALTNTESTKDRSNKDMEDNISLVLQSSNSKPGQIKEDGIVDEPPELLTRSPTRSRTTSSLSPVKLSSTRSIDHETINAEISESGVNFSGDYQLNLKESSDPTEVRIEKE